ncbi:hypothetical protein, partial [Bacillus licheniformis]|uniref:hypothetical protein n=1 Tax=Bacillus licheniformis TaxID=1402 RepID=UPI001C88E461
MYLAQAEELEFGNSDYPEGLPEYEHRYAKFLIELNAFIEKHEISLREPERRQLEWLLFET